MKQTRKQSTIETITNVGTGYFISMALNIFFLPFFVEGIIEQSIVTATIIGIVYTGTSMVRSFAFRRLFNER